MNSEEETNQSSHFLSAEHLCEKVKSPAPSECPPRWLWQETPRKRWWCIRLHSTKLPPRHQGRWRQNKRVFGLLNKCISWRRPVVHCGSSSGRGLMWSKDNYNLCDAKSLRANLVRAPRSWSHKILKDKRWKEEGTVSIKRINWPQHKETHSFYFWKIVMNSNWSLRISTLICVLKLIPLILLRVLQTKQKGLDIYLQRLRSTRPRISSTKSYTLDFDNASA